MRRLGRRGVERMITEGKEKGWGKRGGGKALDTEAGATAEGSWEETGPEAEGVEAGVEAEGQGKRKEAGKEAQREAGGEEASAVAE